jgi:hypothetical protein
VPRGEKFEPKFFILSEIVSSLVGITSLALRTLPASTEQAEATRIIAATESGVSAGSSESTGNIRFKPAYNPAARVDF